MQFRNRLVSILFLLHIPILLFPQFAAVTVEKNSILYAGIDNPLSIVAESTPCNSLVIKTTHGSVTGKDCRYIFQIDFDSVVKNNIHYTDIIIYKNTNGKLKQLTKWVYRIKTIPDPTTFLLRQSKDFRINFYSLQKPTFYDGHPKVPDITSQRDFSLDFDVRFIVDSFKFSIFRGDSCLYKSIANKTNMFSDQTFEIFKTLLGHDQILFDEVHVKGNDGSRRIIKPLRLTVVKDQ